MDSHKKDKDGNSNSSNSNTTIEIGGFYAIIGKDFREYKVEVLGKRVSELETLVYIHYDGTDKRLDEWVDVGRLTPLKDQKKASTPITGGGPGTPGSTDTATSAISTTTDASESVPGGRPKRKAIKDEVAALLESMKRPTSRMRPGEVSQDGSVTKPISPHGHGHGHDHDEEDVPQVRNVEWILYGGYDIATWYYSPYPDEYQDCQRLFICEYCLKYIRTVESFIAHTKSTCKRKRPPGTVVYSKGVNKIYKVDGKTNKLYCQNLCLLAKLFLDNKTLYFDVPGFQFFVLTETRSGDRADVPVGFFSKEIVSYDGYNLACILVLPPFQRKSYGKLLIEFSYELTKIEGKVGSPEKPLSDLGKLGYVSYWTTAILRELYPRPWPAKRSPVPLPGSGTGGGRGGDRRRSRALSSASGTSSSVAAVVAGAGAVVKAEESVNGGVASLMDKVKEEKEDEKVLSDAMDVDPTAATDANTTSTQDAKTPALQQPQKDKEVAFSIRELAARTGIMEEDLMETLVTMGWMSHWQELSSSASSSTSTAVPAVVRNAKRNYRKLKKFQEQQQLFEKFGGASHHEHDGHELEGSSGAVKGHHSHGSRHGHSHGHGHGHGSGSSHSPSSSMNYGTTAMPGTTMAIMAGGAVPTHEPFSSLSGQPLTYLFDPVSILEIPDSEGEDEVVVGSGGVKEAIAATKGGEGEGVGVGRSGDETQQLQAGDKVKVEDGIEGGTVSLPLPLTPSSQPTPITPLQAQVQAQAHATSTRPAAAAAASSSSSSSMPMTAMSATTKDVVAVVTMEMVREYQDRHNIRLDPYLDWSAIDWVAYRSTLEPPQ
ncbi:K(lysine) acetyltransferase [Mortierella sp. AD032]|nr:K(lysine) acetyltransferase [Mortierella sp. AD032]